MPVREEELYGRGQIIQCVEQALRRDGVPDRPLPIVLLVGSRGSGATALLDALWRRFKDRALSVDLDLEAAQGVDDVVYAAMQGLRRRILGIRPVRFDRLRLAFKALSYVDDGAGRAAFETYLRSGTADSAAAALDGWAARAAPLLSSLEQQVLVALLTGAARLMLSGSKRLRDAKALAWFAGNGIHTGPGDGCDALWQLHRWHREGDEAAIRKVGLTLCAALLADLRADYNSSGPLHAQRARNCLLLADNAGNDVGAAFLDLIEQCRRSSAAAGESGDPLLIVAARRSAPPDSAGPPIDADDEALAVRAERGWWYPIRLTDLSLQNVVDIVFSATSGGVLGSARQDAAFVYALCGGHPAATRRFVEVLGRRDGGQGEFDPRRLLEAQEAADPTRGPGGPRLAVEDLLLRRLFAPGELNICADGSLDPKDNALLDAMAVCAATAGLRPGACHAVFKFMGWQLRAVEVCGQFEDRLWTRREPDEAEARVHPLPDLLLRRWLARDANRWRDVHQGFAAYYASPADEALRWRHSLALVEPGRPQQLADVVRYLEAELDKADTAVWLRTLGTVAQAPNRLRTTQDPRTFVTTLAGPTKPGERRAVVARLVVARWLAGDRLFDPGRRLEKVVRDEFDNLAQLSGPQGEAFFGRSA